MFLSIPFLRVIQVLAYVATLLINWAAVAIPLFGRDTGAISDMFPTAITPAGYAFSIWSLIYTLLAGFVILPWLTTYRNHPVWQRLGFWFLVSCVMNMSWIILWHALLISWSVEVMIVLLVSLAVLYVRTRAVRQSGTWAMRVFVSGTFSIYLGWISVATIVNIAVALYRLNWNGWGLSEAQWAIVLLVIAGGLAFYIAYRYRDVAYGGVIAWASYAVAVNQEVIYPDVAWVAKIIAGLIVVNAVFVLWKSRRSVKP